MADDVAITPGAGVNVATDDCSGRHVQVVKMAGKENGVATLQGVYDTLVTLESTGFNSLATSATIGRATAEVDNTTKLYTDVLVMVEAQMTTAGSPTGNVEVYAIWSLDGTEYSGDTSYSGTGAAYTLGQAGSVNLTKLGDVDIHANTATYRRMFSLASAMGGMVPPFWAIVLVNNSGIALHTSGSTVTYRGVV